MSPATTPQTSQPPPVHAAGLTDTGRVRARNEDAFGIDTEAGIFVVADGMGGHRSGDVAASMAVELLPQIYRERAKQLPEGATEDARIADFAATVVEVSQRIQAAGRQKSSCHHMGTTLVAVLIARGHAHITHLGDSRAYVLRKRTLHQLTQDHSVVNMLVQLGEITAEEADTHPAQNQLTAFAGIRRPVHPDVAMLKLRTGDRLLLCTDGLWTTVPSAEMRDILAECATPRTACRRLIAKGNAGGGHDNLTALVVDYTATAASQAASKKNTVKLSPARTQKINAAPGSPPR